MTVAIKIENVSKLYRLGTVGTGTISHDLNRWWHSIRGKEDPYAKVGQVNDRTKAASDEKRETSEDTGDSSPLASRNSRLATSPDYVWALKDINLEVAQGEILGIIGRNGAGKSTLLKLLSRVTAPTNGAIKTKGRIASLLEVGTGFHPELTGRENIYMNGAILGMRRHEIAKQLDAIVDFSGCAKYVDTPVKRYSSGMMVRLGFAVAAHLECEILIVDEVLAVGDTEFQKKCLGKMQAIGLDGRTVLFVSHNLGAVESLCQQAIVIDEGNVGFVGSVSSAISHYQSACGSSTRVQSVKFETSSTDGINPVFFESAETRNSHDHPTSTFRTLDDICFAARLYFRHEAPERVILAFAVHDARQNLVGNILSTDTSTKLEFTPGETEVAVTWKNSPLKDGLYFLSVWIGTEFNAPPLDYHPQCLSFYVNNGTERKIESAAIIHAEASWTATTAEDSPCISQC